MDGLFSLGTTMLEKWRKGTPSLEHDKEGWHGGLQRGNLERGYDLKNK